MKDSQKIKDCLIDDFYNEKKDKNINAENECKEFKWKLNLYQEKLNLLNEDIFEFDINTLSIIEKAECIKKNKKYKREFILFILIAFFILSLYALAILKFGAKFLIISQGIVLIALPWTIIPFSMIRRKESEI